MFCYLARGTGHVRIRIFTPDHELPFAGHPVLGSAFVLAAPLQLPEIVLETGMGPVPVRLERDGPRIVFGWMVQPVPRVEAVADPAPLLRALGVDQFAVYLQHDAKDATLQAYGEQVLPALAEHVVARA